MVFFINATIIRFVCVVLFITMSMRAHKHTYNLHFLYWLLRELCPILSLLTRENILEESSGGPMTRLSFPTPQGVNPRIIGQSLALGWASWGWSRSKGFLLNTTSAASNHLSQVHCEELRFN